MHRVVAFIGLSVLILILYILSNNRKKINWRTVFSGIFLQFFFAIIILKTKPGMFVFDGAKNFFNSILAYTNEGSLFLFGPLVDTTKFGFIFVVSVLPTIIFVSSLMSVLYHLGIMQFFIKYFAKMMVWIMGTSGSESLATAANIFAGQTEAPLVIKPFLKSMTKSEILALMSGGMATVAGGVLAAYVGMGIDAGHLLAASFMSAPAALVCAKILYPEVEHSVSKGELEIDLKSSAENVIDAAATGASEGLKLAVNVAAMLLAFIALIALLNGTLKYLGELIHLKNLSLELIMGYAFSPFAFLIGVPIDESVKVGTLLGKKLVLNEFVAYLDLKEMIGTLSKRSVIISTYALCGFANFSSIAIQVGGIGSLVPERRRDLAKLGLKSLLAGTFACLMTASIAGILLAD